MPSTRAASAALARGTMARLTSRARSEELGEHAAQRLHRPLERQLADEENPLERLARSRPQRAHDGGSDGQIEPAARLFTSAGREIDDDPALVDVDPDLRERALHAHTALANGGLGKTYELEERWPAQRFDLDANGCA
jgi:hypothetical protein